MEILKSPVNILHITFNMGFGGTEQVIRQLVTHLDKANFHNEIACIDGEVGPIGQSLKMDHGIKYHTRRRASGFDLKTVLWLRRLIRSGHFNIVHCHQYSPYIYGWFAHWGTGAKVVFTEHGRFHPDQYRKKAKFINPFIARTSHKLVAISAATRDALVEYEYMPRSKIDIIYNGIAPLIAQESHKERLRSELRIKPGQKVIGTVARLDSVKNQALILRAARSLLDQKYDIRILLVGDGPERQNLEALADQLNLGDSVIFTGFQSDPSTFLSLMDIFLLPSFTEGTSMTLLEAMSLGIPTVATRVGGTPEIVVEGETGTLIKSADLEAFVPAIQNLIDHSTIHKKMSENAKHHFTKRFTAQYMAGQYQLCYKSI